MAAVQFSCYLWYYLDINVFSCHMYVCVHSDDESAEEGPVKADEVRFYDSADMTGLS